MSKLFTLSKFSILLMSGLLSTLPAQANVVGPGTQNFNSITSGIDFVTVHSSETLKPGLINLGLFLNYAVNSLPYFENIPEGRTEFNDGLLVSDFNVGIGLLPNWDVGISFPILLTQTINASTSYGGSFTKNGLTEIRLGTKYRFYGTESYGVASVVSVNFNMVENNPFKGSPANPTVNFELVGDLTVGRAAIALNVGHRWTFPGASVAGTALVPLTNQLIASTAVSYHLPEADTRLISEIFGSIPLARTTSNQDRSASSLEWIVGAKHDITQSLAFHAGLGTELTHGASSPDWRLYTGINYVFGPVFSKEASSLRFLGKKIIIENILFEFDSDVVVGDVTDILKEAMKRIDLEGSYEKLIVSGHTDSIGPLAYNTDLSDRRANRVRQILIDQFKISSEKIEAVGKGPTEPIADNGNFQGRQANRRVEIEAVR